MPEIALTGSSGHLGLIVHRMLQRDGIPHRLLIRDPVGYVVNDEVVHGALEENDKRALLVADCKTVIHCAGKVWPKTGRNASVLLVNCELTKSLYRDAVKAGVEHFIFISSIHSMQVPPGEVVFDESAALVTDPRKAYDFSKAEAERFLSNETEIKVTILNPTAIIGPGDHYLRGLNQLFDRLNRNKLPAVTAGGFSIVDVRDVARAILTACKRQVEGKYILAGKYFTMEELTRKYGEVSGKKVTRRVIGPSFMKFLAKTSRPIDRLSSIPLALNTYSVDTLLEGHAGISSNAGTKNLDFSSRPVEETLSDLHLWFTDQKLIL